MYTSLLLFVRNDEKFVIHFTATQLKNKNELSYYAIQNLKLLLALG